MSAVKQSCSKLSVIQSNWGEKVAGKSDKLVVQGSLPSLYSLAEGCKFRKPNN